MTISTQTRTAGPFTGTGLLAPYPFAFKVFQQSDVLVVRTDPSLAQTTLTLGADYTLALSTDQNAAPGGTVLLLVALPVGYLLTLTSNVAATQPASLTNAGGFFPKTIEDALDRLTVLMQQFGFVSGPQAIRVPDLGGVPPMSSASVRANNLLGFDSLGNPVAVAPIGGSAAALATDLTNTALAAKGAGQVGFSAALGYAAGTVGLFLKNLAGAAASSFVGFIQSGAAAVARSAQDKLRETVSVKDFGAIGDGVAVDTAAILAAVAYAKANNVGLIFPAGTYKYATALVIDWSGARITFAGKVTLLYTGASAYAVAIDGGALIGAVFDVQFGVGNAPIIQAVGTTSGMFCRAVGQNSRVEMKCTAALTRALLVNFAVGASFRVCASNNVDGYVQVPTNGVQLDARGAAELVSDCEFFFIVEGVAGDGVVSTAAVHCTMSGTSEGNGGRGYVESGLSQSNMLTNMDNEANAGADYALGGFGTLLINTLSTSAAVTAVVTGLRNVLQGATFKKLSITAAAYGTVLREVAITSGSGGGNLTDAGANTVFENCYVTSNNGTSPFADVERKPMLKNVGGMPVFSATQAVNCVVTIANNGLDNIESITFAGVGGMTQLNGNTYQVEPVNNSNGFYILTAGTYVNSTAFGAFTAGGTGTVVAFTGTWVNTGGALRTCGYKKDADGTVHLFGNVQAGGTGNPIFTLPVGYRPIATEFFACVNSQVPELASVSITVGGVVTATFATAAGAKISLDNISFMAEA